MLDVEKFEARIFFAINLIGCPIKYLVDKPIEAWHVQVIIHAWCI